MTKNNAKFKMLMPLDIQMFAGNPNESLFWEVMSAQTIATVVDETPYMFDPYIGEALFPPTKVDGLNLSYIKDTRGVPMVLKPSQFDVATPIRDRVSVEALETEMPYFKEGMILGERERQDLFNAFSRSPRAYQQILSRIYDDRTTLVLAADAQAERLRMQALTTGAINIVANGEYLSYDYGIPAAQKHTVAVGDQWNNKDADILKTVKLAKTTVRKATGAQLRYMVMNSDTFDNILVNEQFKNLGTPLAGANAPILIDEEARRLIERYTGLRVILYDKMFKDEQGVMHNYIPEGVVTFIPEGELGRTNYGTTPQEFDLLNSSNHRADVAIVNTGVAITSWKQEDPVNSKTVVSQIVMPSFEQAAHVFIANVYTP